MTSQYDKEVRFTCAVRGYHYYRAVWEPKVNEILNCSHEQNNVFDRFAIKTTKENHNNQIVGHLPMEVSRVIKYLIDRGAEVTAQLTSTNYRRSPLIQGGLEIPCVVVAKMNGYSARNQMILQKFEQLVNDLYAEPKNEEIVGSFLVPVTRNRLDDPQDIRTPPAKKIPKRKSSDVPKCRDIRSFFNRSHHTESRVNKSDKEKDCIVID